MQFCSPSELRLKDCQKQSTAFALEIATYEEYLGDSIFWHAVFGGRMPKFEVQPNMDGLDLTWRCSATVDQHIGNPF